MSYPLQQSEIEFDRLKQQTDSLGDEVLPKLAKLRKNCLEIGCGVGSNVKLVRKYNPTIHYTGVDISKESVEKAKKSYADDATITFQVQNGEKLNFKDETFDLIVLRLVLWSTEKREIILKEAFRVLTKGGQIYCFEPDDQFLIFHPKKKSFESLIEKWRKKISQTGGNVFVGRELPFLLSQAGFSDLKATVLLKSYIGSDQNAYLGAARNLWNIFCSNGASYFDLKENSPEWENAKKEIESAATFDTLTEGYFIVVGGKQGNEEG